MNRGWLLGGLLFMGGLGLAKVLTARPKITKATRLLVIGDSMAQGLIPQLKALAADLRVPFQGRGVPGTRIDQWADSVWLEEQLSAFQPTLVIVVLGTNDAYLGGDVWGKQQDAFATLLHRLRSFPNRHVNNEPGDEFYSAGAEIVWVGPPALPARYSGRAADVDFLQALRKHAPHYFASDELTIPRAPDGLHPTISGYAGWAGAIWSWLT